MESVHLKDDQRREEGEELHVHRQEPGVPHARPRRRRQQVVHVDQVRPAATLAQGGPSRSRGSELSIGLHGYDLERCKSEERLRLRSPCLNFSSLFGLDPMDTKASKTKANGMVNLNVDQSILQSDPMALSKVAPDPSAEVE